MQSKKEQRKAEFARKQRAAQAGAIAAPAPVDEAEVLGHVPRHGGEYIGCDKARRYVGEIGRVTPQWLESHAGDNHGFATGDWWLKVGDKDYVAFAERWTANKALLQAGAVGIQMPKGPEYSNDEEDDSYFDRIQGALARCSEWAGFDKNGKRVGQGGQVTDLWLELLGKDFREFKLGSFWVTFDDDFGPEWCQNLQDVQYSLTDAGAVTIQPVVHDPVPDEAVQGA